MDRYRQFIERIRQSEPQMPGSEDLTDRIMERVRTIPQETSAGTRLQPGPGTDNIITGEYGAFTPYTRRIRMIAALTGATAALLTVVAVLPAAVPDRTDCMTEISDITASTGENKLDRYRKLKAQAEFHSRIKALASKKYNNDYTEQ